MVIRIKSPNREKRLRPRRRRKTWCDGCDRCLVFGWSKCPVCGHRNGIRRNKK